MFAKDKVPQSLIDAVNKVLAVEDKKPEQLNEAFPTVADAQKRASEPKPSGGAGIKLGTRYGGGRQADEPEKDDDEPKARAKYGARKTRFTNTKLYKEEDDCVDEPKAKEIAKKEVGKHEKSMHKEELKGKQHKIDANKNGKIDAHDFELLRSKKKKMTEGLSFAERLVESMYGKKSALPLDEKEMTDAQKKKKEDIVMSMKKDTEGLKKRYGSRWKEVMYATATKRAMGETYGEEVEMEEEIDPDVRSKDALSGANKPTKQKDDVGPGADGRSTKVKFKAGPMSEEKEEDEKEDEGHEDEKEDKALVKKMVKKDALKEEEQLDEISKKTVKSYLSKTVDPVHGIPKSKEKLSQRMKGISAAHQRIVGNKPTSEEVEQIDELSKDTLSSYLQKRGSMVSPRSKNNKGNENMAKAVNKMANKKTNEEVEQIDELSHDTLRSYVDKAKKENLPGKGGNRGVALLTPGTRDKGVHRAVDRMRKMKANEEVEIQENEREDAEDMYFAKKNKPKSLKSFLTMKKEMIGKAGMTSEKKDEE